MNAWVKVWREGIAPLLSTTGLTALARALKDDDPRLLQGATCTPPPLQAVQDWPVEAADAVAFCHVVDHGGFSHSADPIYGTNIGRCTVAEAEEFFARVCFECDGKMGEPAACRWFLNFWDETPREELFALMIPEVARVLECRRLNVGMDILDEALHDLSEENPCEPSNSAVATSPAL